MRLPLGNGKFRRTRTFTSEGEIQNDDTKFRLLNVDHINGVVVCKSGHMQGAHGVQTDAFSPISVAFSVCIPTEEFIYVRELEHKKYIR